MQERIISDGEYEGFTGYICTPSVEGMVSEATFDIIKGRIVSYRGVWEYGAVVDGVFRDGALWRKGTWRGGNWFGGTWENGIWYRGTWKGGIWLDGDWLAGTWKGGKWLVELGQETGKCQCRLK